MTPLKAMKRIMIFGLPGSGKSTFAGYLGQLLGLPVYHLDRYFFTANWQARDYQEFLDLQQKLVEEPAWVIDGNASKSLEVRFAQADIVIYFRFKRLLCLWRVFKRMFSADQVQASPPGCSKKVRWQLITYLWGFEKRVQGKVEGLRQQYPGVLFYEFHSDEDALSFCAEIG
ncbi:MAG: DNA topology modulation protein [Parachlamydia sp.]|nr:MAG: DNA topology modulation protein [Parachlamydia sp.]